MKVTPFTANSTCLIRMFPRRRCFHLNHFPLTDNGIKNDKKLIALSLMTYVNFEFEQIFDQEKNS